MDERRKRAYRYLLYQAMLDIRPVAWLPLGRSIRLPGSGKPRKFVGPA
ncbi:hypothetical protein LOC68_18560 [Blastopirellula sp. JC732]|uniref:Uncharacterized protein n=1 Tax=Blastopirellula sediminis TaxID=2894196 RepID=A0A9X1SI16_9BACT|nr:hypothetical protein [Blastopirellula sediminis]MCC9606301.1 hypothetical protein [Blastopirellula sediminis]MCC9630401.1 hypothetical protein [Blastopirellula sediminis]